MKPSEGMIPSDENVRPNNQIGTPGSAALCGRRKTPEGTREENGSRFAADLAADSGGAATAEGREADDKFDALASPLVNKRRRTRGQSSIRRRHTLPTLPTLHKLRAASRRFGADTRPSREPIRRSGGAWSGME